MEPSVHSHSLLPDPLASVRMGLDRFERRAVCFLAFVMPACNGRPFALSSGFLCLPVAVALLLHVNLKDPERPLVPRHSKATALLFGLWVLVATLSTLVNFREETALNLLWGYWTPFLIFLSLTRLRPEARDFQPILASFALGLATRFAYGTLMFYQEWGIPSLSDLLVARYDLDRMATYMDATFGNTGNSASLLAISLPVLVLSLLLAPLRKAVRGLVLVSVVILTANILITGSRAAILLATVVLVATAFKLQVRWGFLLLLGLGIAAFCFISYAGDTFIGRMEAVLRVDSQGDASLAERFESIRYGLGMVRDFPMGVGPGLSRLYNPFQVPHQFAVSQGSDLGILGLLTSATLAAVILYRFIRCELDMNLIEHQPASIFFIGVFGWTIFAMTTNIPVNSGPTIPWIGLFAMFLAHGNIGLEGGMLHPLPKSYSGEVIENELKIGV